MDTPTKPGHYLYFAEIEGCDPCRVELRDTGEQGLGVFFEGRDDYDLASEVSGRFEPVA